MPSKSSALLVAAASGSVLAAGVYYVDRRDQQADSLAQLELPERSTFVSTEQTQPENSIQDQIADSQDQQESIERTLRVLQAFYAPTKRSYSDCGEWSLDSAYASSDLRSIGLHYPSSIDSIVTDDILNLRLNSNHGYSDDSNAFSAFIMYRERTHFELPQADLSFSHQYDTSAADESVDESNQRAVSDRFGLDSSLSFSTKLFQEE